MLVFLVLFVLLVLFLFLFLFFFLLLSTLSRCLILRFLSENITVMSTRLPIIVYYKSVFNSIYKLPVLTIEQKTANLWFTVRSWLFLCRWSNHWLLSQVLWWPAIRASAMVLAIWAMLVSKRRRRLSPLDYIYASCRRRARIASTALDGLPCCRWSATRRRAWCWTPTLYSSHDSHISRRPSVFPATTNYSRNILQTNL